MAGRHRKPPAWRRTLTSLLRSRNRVRVAALRAEILALRATVASLQEELARLREAEAVAAAARTSAVEPGAPTRGVMLDLPLVRLALADVAVDRGHDTALTEIVLEPASAPADRLAWSVLANLPERPLLDPRLDRATDPVDHAAEPAARHAAAAEDPVAPHRRSA